MSTGLLAGRTALVTGAGSGIGRAIAKRLHGEGASVILTGRRADRLDETASLLGGERVHCVPADLTVPADAARLVQAALAAAGRLDVLVNNAGAMRFGRVESAPDALWQEMMEVNAFGPMRLMRAALPALRASGGGSIVNIASIAGEQALPGNGPYGTAKRALRHLSQVLAMEVASEAIRVNVICPGVVEGTELIDSFFPRAQVEGFFRTFAPLHPLGRNGQPEDVADAVLFLASDLSRWITGAVLPLDGGRHLATNRPPVE